MRIARIPAFEIRPSRIDGYGAFALRRIRKGTRLIEYRGERIPPAEADKRYDVKHSRDPRVLLFSIDDKTVIDGGVDGNDARFINHSCDPNCEAVVERRRVWIYALRDIEPGEELTYDYNLIGDEQDHSEEVDHYSCHCGAKHCRGTMFAPS